MAELRWILIGVGLLLLAGLWWWETHRRRGVSVAKDADDSDEPASQTPSPGSADHAVVAAVPEKPADQERGGDLPSIRASRRERGMTGRNPPIVEIPADAEPEIAATRDSGDTATNIPYRSMQKHLDELPADLRDLPRDERLEAEQRQPWVRTQPLDRDEVMGRPRSKKVRPEKPAEEGGAPKNGAESEASTPGRQKIVALRLIAENQRWPGTKLVAALTAEGLTFGKYSIYHRERDDGKSIFFVASMVEPGSFDLQEIDKLEFPGVSIFAVIPGPLDAPVTFDMMLATARRLVDRLGGHLQDEQGSTLTAQRILNLREELVHFEHITRRVQRP
jgi:cell division protein ZipA